jgi:hypothetical protein
MKIVVIGGSGLVGGQGARCFTMPFNTWLRRSGYARANG